MGPHERLADGLAVLPPPGYDAHRIDGSGANLIPLE